MKENNRPKPAAFFLHGGGLSDWSFDPVRLLLEPDYQVVTPVLPGHGSSRTESFISIEQTAEDIIETIETEFDGHISLLGGLSVGAQIVCEILSRRPAICDYAIIESALVKPIPGVRFWASSLYKILYPITKNSWFAGLQGRSMNLPEAMLPKYINDSMKMSCDSLINLTLSNGLYRPKEGLAQFKGIALIIAGTREPGMMVESARLLAELIPESRLIIKEGFRHGELSLKHPEQYISLLSTLKKD